MRQILLLLALMLISSIANAANPNNAAASLSVRSPIGYTDGSVISVGTAMAYSLHYSQTQGFNCDGTETKLAVLSNQYIAPNTFLSSTADLSQLDAGTWYFKFSVNNSGCSTELTRAVTGTTTPLPELIFDAPTSPWVELQ